MRDNSFDRTIARSYVQKWRFLIGEYEQVKAGKSDIFKTVGAFYKAHGTCSQTFRKYYNRFLQSSDEKDLLPQKRGAKWRERWEPLGIETEIREQRRRGLNRYQIHALLRERHGAIPSPSTIYRILRRYGENRPPKPMPEEKRRIIKERPGELGHVDLHQLPRDMFITPPERTAYVICLLDSCSRLTWAEVVTSKKSLPVMFKALKMANTLNETYGLVFEEILTDNGAEFAARATPDDHPFEQMLIELGIKHRYTRPYRPQTNGKAERFWRTLNEDVIEGASYDDLDHFARELLEYLVFYNNYRPHQAIGGKTPKAYAEAVNEKARSANC